MNYEIDYKTRWFSVQFMPKTHFLPYFSQILGFSANFNVKKPQFLHFIDFYIAFVIISVIECLNRFFSKIWSNNQNKKILYCNFEKKVTIWYFSKNFHHTPQDWFRPRLKPSKLVIICQNVIFDFAHFGPWKITEWTKKRYKKYPFDAKIFTKKTLPCWIFFRKCDEIVVWVISGWEMRFLL